MKFKKKSVIYFAVFAAIAFSCRAQSAKHDERGLWGVWLTGTNSSFVAADVVAACKEFKSKNPDDSLTIVVSGFEAWHYLKTGNTKAAVEIFDSMLIKKGSGTGLQQAGDRMARSWLTRLDREQVAASLKKLYLKNIEFPASLEPLKGLKELPLPPLTDRWDKPWEYSLGSSIKGMGAHRYKLESSVLGSRSYLKKALQDSYASGIDLTPVRMVRNSRDVVEFRTVTGSSVVRQAGDKSSRVNLDYLGSNIIVLSDGDHWSVMAKPR